MDPKHTKRGVCISYIRDTIGCVELTQHGELPGFVGLERDHVTAGEHVFEERSIVREGLVRCDKVEQGLR